jgi:glycerol-3-phosphate acyltransferase PlsY
MNVALSVTRWAGALVFLAEAAKGILAVELARWLVGTELAIAVTVLATVIGTRWMIWLGFAGGRGNTAGLGAVLRLSWPTLAIGVAFWVLVRWLGRSSFWATRLSLLVWPLVFGGFTRSWTYLLSGVALSAIYLTTHRTASDDHTLIKQRWPSLLAFLTGPKRRSR